MYLSTYYLYIATAFDHRLRLAIIETLVDYYEANGQLPEAILFATKGCVDKLGTDPITTGTIIPEYYRKRVVEQVSRLTLLQTTAGGASTAAVDKGGKGKGGGGAVTEAPKLTSAFLNVFATIIQAELPVSIMSVEQSKVLIQKAIDLLEKDVKLELDTQMDASSSVTQERFSQLLEMQTEAWTRLTRLRMMLGDTIGSQYTAEKCLELVSYSTLSDHDRSCLNARVWRWVSVCERYFGQAIASIIQPTGQDLSLQNDLRLVTLDHFLKSCQYGTLSAYENLVVEVATLAWNISIPLISNTTVRAQLYHIQRGIIDNLIKCRNPNYKAASDKLMQQFYLAIIEGYANVFDWDNATKIVMEAFTHVPTSLQKPLWQWRVIAMSKKGKSVLDGLQKLKEGDPSLQAQVYGVLARASTIPEQQLESYMTAITILQESIERVDYILEAAQWMGSNSIPRIDIMDLVESAVDALYEIEERKYPELADLDEEEVELLLKNGTYCTVLGHDGYMFDYDDDGGDFDDYDDHFVDDDDDDYV